MPRFTRACHILFSYLFIFIVTAKNISMLLFQVLVCCKDEVSTKLKVIVCYKWCCIMDVELLYQERRTLILHSEQLNSFGFHCSDQIVYTHIKSSLFCIVFFCL